MQRRRRANLLQLASAIKARATSLHKPTRRTAAGVAVFGVIVGTSIVTAATNPSAEVSDGDIKSEAHVEVQTDFKSEPAEQTIQTLKSESDVQNVTTPSVNKNSNNSHTTVTVNDETVTIPSNTSYTKTVTSNDGTTTVTVDQSNNGGSNFSSTSTHVHSFSHSTNMSGGTHVSNQ